MTLPTGLTRDMLSRDAHQLAAAQPRDEVDLQDFSVDRTPVRFSADGEIYECHSVMPLSAMQNIMRIVRDGVKLDDTANVDAAVQKIIGIFEQLMPPDQADRFTARLKPGHALPLDLRRQVLPIMRWILEKYGVRPTEPSSSSSASSPTDDAGTSSTGGAPSAE